MIGLALFFQLQIKPKSTQTPDQLSETCKTPKDAVIPVGSCLELTTQRARHSNSLGTHTNEFNYRYHEHRPLRLWITLGNSGMLAERKPGVCNEFCHVYSLGLSSFIGRVTVFSLWFPTARNTYECCDNCQKRGEENAF